MELEEKTNEKTTEAPKQGPKMKAEDFVDMVGKMARENGYPTFIIGVDSGGDDEKGDGCVFMSGNKKQLIMMNHEMHVSMLAKSFSEQMGSKLLSAISRKNNSDSEH